MGREFVPAGGLSDRAGFARGVLLLDDCEGTFVWEVAGSGGDDVHDFAGVAAFHGANGMRLISRTTAAAIGDGVIVSRMLGFPESGLLVYRLRMCLPDVSAVANVSFTVDIFDGVDNYAAVLLWLPNTPLAMYMDATGGFTPIAGLGAGAMDGAWFLFEMVLDVRAMAYERLAMNGVVIYMGGAGCAYQMPSALRGVEVRVGYLTSVAAAVPLYADNFYVGEFVDL